MTESPTFLKLCEIKVSLCSKKMTKPYNSLFRNTRENCDDMREKIFEIYNVPYLMMSKPSWCVAKQLIALQHSEWGFRFESWSSKYLFILFIGNYWFNMQNIEILENYPKHMPLECNFIFKPYVQVLTELPWGFSSTLRLMSGKLTSHPSLDIIGHHNHQNLFIWVPVTFHVDVP